MTSEEVRTDMTSAVIEEIKAVTNDESMDIGLETKIEDTGLDSLDFSDLVFDLEERFGIAVENTEIQSIRTVRDIADLLGAKIEVPA